MWFRLNSFLSNYRLFIFIVFIAFCIIDLLGSLSIIFFENYTFQNMIIRIIKAFLGIPLFISILYLPFVFLLKNRFSIIIALLWGYAALAFVNQLYMRVFSTIMPFSMYTEFQNLNGLSQSIIALFSFQDIGYLLIPSCVSFWYYKKIKGHRLQISLGERCKMSLYISCLSLMLFLPVFLQKMKKSNFAENFIDILSGMNVCLPKLSYQDFGLLPLLYSNYQLDMENEEYILSEEAKLEIEKYFTKFNVSVNSVDTFPERKNLILILVESLNSNALTTQINGKHVMPNLHKCMLDSTTLYTCKLKHLDQSGSSIAGQFSLVTGLIGTSDVPFCILYPHNKYPSIIRELKGGRKDLKSTTVVGTEKTYWRQNLVNISVDCDSLFGTNEISHYRPKATTWLKDKDLFDFSYYKIKNREDVKDPFYFLVVTSDMHAPYVQKGESDLVFSEEMSEELQIYYSKANETDRYIGEFIQKLKSDGIYENTLIAVMADHNIPESYLPKVTVGEDNSNINQISEYTPVLFINTGKDQTCTNNIIKNKVFAHQQIYPTLIALLNLHPQIYKGLFPSILDINNCEKWCFDEVSRFGANDSLKKAYCISDAVIKGNYWGIYQ